jgi:hypothetical protein
MKVHLAGDGRRDQAYDADQVVGGGHEKDRQVCSLQAAEARATEPAHRLQSAEGLFNGLFANDKFCWSRPARLHLNWWHRAYRDR